MECMFGRAETSDRIHQFKSWLHFVHKVSADFKIKFQFYQQGRGGFYAFTKRWRKSRKDGLGSSVIDNSHPRLRSRPALST